MTFARFLTFAALALALSGCKQSTVAARPRPWEITSASVAYFCGMGLGEHSGPKGQVFIAGRKAPYWFSSVRETIAFTRLPEEPRDIVAIYVNDMGKATNWAHPQAGTWIDAKRAWYVLGSRLQGGMHVSEAVPFGTRGQANAFAIRNGGRIVRFEAIPDDYIFPGDDAALGASDEKLKE